MARLVNPSTPAGPPAPEPLLSADGSTPIAHNPTLTTGESTPQRPRKAEPTPFWEPGQPEDREPAPSKPFVLIGTPDSYAVLHDGDGGLYIAPVLFPQYLEGGSAGVNVKHNGKLDITGLVEDVTQAGRYIVPFDRRYCRQVSPGRWLAAWEVRDQFDQPVPCVESQQIYRAFIEALYADGIVERPSATALQALRVKVLDLVQRARSQKIGEPDSLAALEAQLEAVDRAIAAARAEGRVGAGTLAGRRPLGFDA